MNLKRVEPPFITGIVGCWFRRLRSIQVPVNERLDYLKGKKAHWQLVWHGRRLATKKVKALVLEYSRWETWINVKNWSLIEGELVLNILYVGKSVFLNLSSEQIIRRHSCLLWMASQEARADWLVISIILLWRCTDIERAVLFYKPFENWNLFTLLMDVEPCNLVSKKFNFQIAWGKKLRNHAIWKASVRFIALFN